METLSYSFGHEGRLSTTNMLKESDRDISIIWLTGTFLILLLFLLFLGILTSLMLFLGDEDTSFHRSSGVDGFLK